MSDSEPRPWWQDGVLGWMVRYEETNARLVEAVRAGSATGDGLGLDGMILPSSGLAREPETLDAARDVGLRILVDLASEREGTADEVATTARSWLDRGVAGVAVDAASPLPEKRATVTPLFPATIEPDRADEEPWAAVRRMVDSFAGRILVGRRRAGDPAELRKGPHLTIESLLDRQPWRASSLGAAIESVEAALPAGAWPSYAMGAPRRGPFAVGLPLDDAMACAAVLHLTLRGTPCIELGGETGLPAHAARRRWYRRLIALRRSEVALRRGGWRRLAQPAAVLGFLREHEADRIAVLVNPSRRAREAHLPTAFPWTVLLATDWDEPRRLPVGPVRLPANGALIARAGPPQSRALGSSGRRRATGR